MPLFIRQPMWWYNVPDTGPRDPRSILHPRGRHTGRRYQELNHRWGSRPLNKWPPTFSFRNNNIFSSSSILNHWYCILQSIGFTDILTSNQAFPIMYCWILVELQYSTLSTVGSTVCWEYSWFSKKIECLFEYLAPWLLISCRVTFFSQKIIWGIKITQLYVNIQPNC